MKFTRTLKPLALTLTLLAGACGAQAALVARNGGMVYDTDKHLTYISDLAYAKTSGHDADGLMGWQASMAWADQLQYGGHSDWRLASLLEVQDLLNNELGYWVGAPAAPSADQQAQRSLFSGPVVGNGDRVAFFWSGDLNPANANQAGLIRVMSDGSSTAGFAAITGGRNNAPFLYNTVVVRGGDVGGEVPEPSSLALAALAVAGLGAARWRHRR